MNEDELKRHLAEYFRAATEEYVKRVAAAGQTFGPKPYHAPKRDETLALLEGLGVFDDE